MGGGDFQIAQDPLSALNPADIEDITVLKDASAYGNLWFPRCEWCYYHYELKKGRQVRLK